MLCGCDPVLQVQVNRKVNGRRETTIISVLREPVKETILTLSICFCAPHSRPSPADFRYSGTNQLTLHVIGSVCSSVGLVGARHWMHDGARKPTALKTVRMIRQLGIERSYTPLRPSKPTFFHLRSKNPPSSILLLSTNSTAIPASSCW